MIPAPHEDRSEQAEFEKLLEDPALHGRDDGEWFYLVYRDGGVEYLFTGMGRSKLSGTVGEAVRFIQGPFTSRKDAEEHNAKIQEAGGHP